MTDNKEQYAADRIGDQPAAVWGIIEQYQCQAPEEERKDFRQHAERVAQLVDSFAGGMVPEQAIIAAAMHDLADRVHPYGRKYAAENRMAQVALMDILTGPALHSVADVHYIATLLSDMVALESKMDEVRARMSWKQVQQGDTTPGLVSALMYDRPGVLPPEVWEQVAPEINLQDKLEFIEQTNVEAVLIKSCEMIDNLQHPGQRSGSSLLRDTVEVESYLGPLVEIMGFEGLSAAMRSEAIITRFKATGKEQVIGAAREQIDRIREAGVEGLVSKVLTVGRPEASRDQVVTRRVVKEIPGKRPVVMGEFAVETDDGTLLAGNYRLKTVGSLAKKIDRGNLHQPMDMVGMMVIANDHQELIDQYVAFASQMIDDGDIQLEAAGSHNRALYVQGSPEFTRQLEQRMHAAGLLEQVEIKTDDPAKREQRGHGIYEVAKMTFYMQHGDISVPTELQFVTKQERDRARLGEVSHIGYKAGGGLSSQDAARMREIYRRKEYAAGDGTEINPRTKSRGEAMVDYLGKDSPQLQRALEAYDDPAKR